MTERSPNPADPQCPYLLQRIDELQADLRDESEPTRSRHWRRQLQLLRERARRLGCYNEACRAASADAAVP